MSNIFSDLFKYRQRKEISPLENYTTEILKHILLENSDLLTYFLKKLNIPDLSRDNISILSQAELRGKGYADILITDFNEFGIIIENKIGADFQDKQIIRYNEYLSQFTYKHILVLLVYSYDFNNKIGVPDEILYWSELANIMKGFKNAYLEKSFIDFLKENNMALTKVNYYLLDGLKEKQNLLNLIRNILTKYVNDEKITKRTKDSHSEDYNDLHYHFKEYEVNINFIHSRCILYFLLNNPNTKHNFPDMDLWPALKVVGKYDFNKEHFFPLDVNGQYNELFEFFESCFSQLS